MFTKNPVTPVRLEILIELLRVCHRGLARKEAYRILQPEPLAPELSSSGPAFATVKAALLLGLVEESDSVLSLSVGCRKLKDTRAAILNAFDARVLFDANVENDFALFFAYFLGLGKQVYARASFSKEQWAEKFNEDVFADDPQVDRFNGTKLTGLHRWFHYAGLGWYDPYGNFQANPCDRLQRALPAIFEHQRKLDADVFMTKLAATCPELDGGEIFLQANPEWDVTQKQCTLGLSHALVELHLDGVVRIACPADSTGWSFGEAEPPRDEDFLSDRFTTIQFQKS